MNNMKVLPLSSIERLRQILSGMPCQFGFSKTALESIGNQVKRKRGFHCYGSLILDEMKVCQTVDFHQATFKLQGFLDYGKDSAQKELPDHGLVLMYVPLFNNWVQPIASFASKVATPGDVLARLVLEAVLELFKQHAVVIAVVSDGAGSNKAMLPHFNFLEDGKLL